MPQRKLSQQDIESWGVDDVIHWFTSVKLGDSECVEEVRFKKITGRMLLQLTDGEIRNLRCNQNNEKRRKHMKTALSKLPGNCIVTSKQQKGRKFSMGGKPKADKARKTSKGLRKSKSPSPSHGPTPGHNPGPAFGGPVPDQYLDDFDEGLYDRPDEVIKAHLQKTQGYTGVPSPQVQAPLASPPFNSNPDHGYQDDGPEEIYEEGYEDEDELDDDSFSSGSFEMSDYEEPFEEEEAVPPLPSMQATLAISEQSRQRAPSQGSLSILQLKKKFEVMGLSDQQGGGMGFTAGPKSTSSGGSHIHPSVETDEVFEEEDEDDIYDLPPQSEDQFPDLEDEDDIYDKVPEEILEVAKARLGSGAPPTNTEAPPPPGAPPPDDGPEEIYGEFEDEEEGEGMYDIPEEALQEYKMTSGQDQEPEDGIMEDIYDTADQDEPPTSPPITQPPRPPKPGGTSSPFPPSSPYLPRNPGQSPQLPRRADQSPQLPRRADQSPQLPRRADQSPQLPRRADQSPQLPRKSNQSPQFNRKAGQLPQLNHNLGQSSQWSRQAMPQFNKPQLRPPIGSHVPQPQEEEAPPPRPPKPSEPSPAPSPSEIRRAKSPVFVRPELSRPPIRSSTLPPPRPSSNIKPSLPEQVKGLSPKLSSHSSPSKFDYPAGDKGHTLPSPPPVPPLPADMDEDVTTRFPKPSEMKGSNLKSLGKFSGSPTPGKKAMPAPVVESSKSRENPWFGAKTTPSPSTKTTPSPSAKTPPSPSATQNGIPNRTIETKTTSGGLTSDRPKVKPPLPTKNVSKIKDLMNRFEQNKQSQAENTSAATNASAVKPDLPTPQKPAANRSPQTGRKMIRKSSFDELKNKYNKPKGEGQAQTLGNSRRVPSLETQPSLPPKPGAGQGVGPGRMQWQRNQIDPSVEQSSRMTEPPDEPMPPPEPPRPPKGSHVSNSPRASPWQRKKIEPAGGPPSIPTRMTEPPDEPMPPPEPPRPPKGSQVSNSPRASPWQRKRIDSTGGHAPSIPTRMTEPPDEPMPPPEPPRPPKDSQVGNSPRASPWQRKKIEPAGGPPSIPTRVKEEPPASPQPPRSAKPEAPAPREEESIVSPSSQQSAKPFVYRPFSRKDLQPPQPQFQPEPQAQPQSQFQYSPEDSPRLPEKPRPGFKSPEASQEVPKLPDRLPPSSRPSIPADSFSEPPKLPSRPPPQRHPSISSPSESVDQPQLPPRPGRQQVPDQPPQFAPPPLPSRPKPNGKPPAISAEPPLPARPPKPVESNSGSPIGQIWYHSNLDRKKAEAKLKRYAKNGTFIIRDSTRVPGEYSLSLYYDGSIRHLRIRVRADKKFVLGEAKEDELAFDAVTELVSYHKGEPLVLKSGGETTLKYECPQ